MGRCNLWDCTFRGVGWGDVTSGIVPLGGWGRDGGGGGGGGVTLYITIYQCNTI